MSPNTQPADPDRFWYRAGAHLHPLGVDRFSEHRVREIVREEMEEALERALGRMLQGLTGGDAA